MNASSSAPEAPSVQVSPSAETTSYATSSVAPGANTTIPVVVVAPPSSSAAAATAADGLCTCGSTNADNIGTPSWNGGNGDKPGDNDNLGGGSGSSSNEESNTPDSAGSEVGSLNGAPAGGANGLASAERSLSVAMPSPTESVMASTGAGESSRPTGLMGAAPSSGVGKERIVGAKAVRGPRNVWVPLVAALGGTAVVFVLL